MQITFFDTSFLFSDIGLTDGQEVVVADSTTPKPIICRIYFSSGMEWNFYFNVLIKRFLTLLSTDDLKKKEK